MRKKIRNKKRQEQKPVTNNDNLQNKKQSFHLEFLNQAQKLAWGAFDQHDVLFLIGPAGCGKTMLACAFGISEIISKKRKKIILTRPIVEAGESLGYLPGSFEEKVNPYMMPMYDCIDRCIGRENELREMVNKSMEIAPLAYLRGRAEVLDSLLITPDGPKPMGDIKIDDYVIGSDGKPTKVTGVYPQGKKKIWRINFSDKTFVECSEDHLWSTMTLNEKRHNKGYTVKTTKKIVETIKNKHNQKIHRMPELTGVVDFKTKEVSIDPYLLGVMLGDGHIRDNALKLTTNDEEIIEICSKLVPAGTIIKKSLKYDYNIVSERRGSRNVLLSEFKKYELSGKLSFNKFIPQDYKINSAEVRLEVLRGLMDTDGSVFLEKRNKKIRTQFYTTSHQLAKDVMFLVRSLGGFAYYRKREFDESDSHLHDGKIIRHVHPSYAVDIRINQNPFKLTRKSKKYEEGIKSNYVKLISSAEYIGEKECQCISVAAENKLYLTNDFNITHNTFHDSICIFDEAQNATASQLKLFMTRFGQNSKIIITGDPDQSDLHPRDQGLMQVVKKIETLNGVGVVYFKANSIVRHPLIASILEKLGE